MQVMSMFDENEVHTNNKAETPVYKFKRKMFYQVKQFIDNSNKYVCTLTGPRKIGKTVCLKQIESLYGNTCYVDFKSVKDIETIWDRVYASIDNDEELIFLLDEITHCECADIYLEHLAVKLQRPSKCKIIITGSQAVAIRSWMMSSFATNAEYVRTSFLDFEEWLVFRGKQQNYAVECCVTEEDFRDYVLHVSDFLNINSNKEYVEGCLSETVISNAKSFNKIYGMAPTDTLDSSNVCAILFIALLRLHNGFTYTAGFDKDNLLKGIRHNYNVYHSPKIKEDTFIEAVSNSIIKGFNLLRAMTLDSFKKSLYFLLECDMITITYVTDLAQPPLDIMNWIRGRVDIDLIKSIEDFLSLCNVSIKYPLFYVNILDDIARNLGCVTSDELLTPPILGSILECYVRGLLSYDMNGQLLKEFRNDAYNEVDIVDDINDILLEITISDKTNKKLWFSSVPNHKLFRKILLTKTYKSVTDVERIPYYEFVYQRCKSLRIS